MSNEAWNCLLLHRRHWLLEVIVLMSVTWLCPETVFAGAAPIWPSRLTYPLVRDQRADWPASWESFDQGAWGQAARIERFFSMGAGEADARRTEVRMLQLKGTLSVFARCHDDQPEKIKTGQADQAGDQEDSLEILIACGPGGGHPLLRVQINAAGHCEIARELIPTSMWGEVLSERVDQAMVKSAAKADKHGWWAAVELPLADLGVPQDKFRMNIMRNRQTDGSRFAWVDLWGGRFRNLFRMGTAAGVAAAPEPSPSIQLPATLSLGSNVIKLAGWRDGYVLKADAKPAAVDATGSAVVHIAKYGPVELSIEAASGRPNGGELIGYTCDVRRPLIVHAQTPFGGDIDKPLSVNVTLDIAGDAKVPITLEALQDGKRIGQAQAGLPAGTHKVDLPLQGAKAGEVRIFASAELSMPGGKTPLAARHWCVLGEPAAKADRFRDGIDELSARSLVRAAVSDAGNYWRLAQAGDGVFVLRKNESLWPQGITHLMAVLYKSDWPENPYRKDERFLASAAAGMEAAMDPARRQNWLNDPDNRSLQAFLMTYELLKDDVPPSQASNWKALLTEIVESVVEIWMRPAACRLSRYSEDVGTGTNHWAFHAANVYTAGRVLARRDWLELGRRELLTLARQERDGQFAERRGVPTLGYNWLTQTALAEYFLQSSDQDVAPLMKRCAAFAWHASLPDGQQLTLYDGRVNSGATARTFPLSMMFAPEGRRLARTCLLAQIAQRTPSRITPEAWHRWGELAAAFPPDAEALPAAEYEFAFMDGLALVVKRKSFLYGLSAICLPPIKRALYRLDPQNAFELHHAQAGFILRGNNSQEQPEAGSFYRKLPDRTVWMPSGGRIVRTADGHAVTLAFEGFKVCLRVAVLSENSVQVKVALLEAAGDEPVVFNFFPTGPDAQLSPDGLKIQSGRAMITASSPVEMDKAFRIFNPYSGKIQSPVKPIRAFAALDKSHPLVLTVKIAD